mgnify:CR=1 FL=1
MNTQINPLLLFSVSRSDKPVSANNANHEMAHRVLQTLGYRFVSGVGVTRQWGRERMFLVVLPPRSASEYDARVASLQDLMQKYDQDAYLYIHEDRHAELAGASGRKLQDLGVFKEVSKAEAENRGNYTIIGDKFYTAS